MSRVISVFKATMASGGTLSARADLQAGWQYCYLEIPTMTSNTQIHIQALAASDSNNEATSVYRRVRHPPLNSSTVDTNVFAIASSATGCMVPIPNGFRYLKIETTATVNDGCLFRIVCTD